MIKDSDRENRHVPAPGFELSGDHQARKTGRLGLFKPTGRRYTYTAVAGRAVRSRRASLEPGFCVDRNGVEIGRYDDSEIQRQARKLALATAEKVFRES
jgi:hypothetical protein